MSYITPSMILTPLISSIITGLIAYLVGRLQKTSEDRSRAKEDRENEIRDLYGEIKKCKDCDRAILHEMILQKCNAILDREYVYPDELDELEYLYKPYANNDGNHRAGNAYEMVLKLPRKLKEEDKK